MLNIEMHERMHSNSKISNFKPWNRIFSYFGQYASGQKKSVRDKKIISKKEEHLLITDGIFWSKYFNQR